MHLNTLRCSFHNIYYIFCIRVLAPRGLRLAASHLVGRRQLPFLTEKMRNADQRGEKKGRATYKLSNSVGLLRHSLEELLLALAEVLAEDLHGLVQVLVVLKLAVAVVAAVGLEDISAGRAEEKGSKEERDRRCRWRRCARNIGAMFRAGDVELDVGVADGAVAGLLDAVGEGSAHGLAVLGRFGREDRHR